MHLNNDRCLNEKCKKLLHPDNYVTVGGKDFCDEKCYFEWWHQDHKKDDFSIPFVR